MCTRALSRHSKVSGLKEASRKIKIWYQKNSRRLRKSFTNKCRRKRAWKSRLRLIFHANKTLAPKKQTALRASLASNLSNLLQIQIQIVLLRRKKLINILKIHSLIANWQATTPLNTFKKSHFNSEHAVLKDH